MCENKNHTIPPPASSTSRLSPQSTLQLIENLYKYYIYVNIFIQ